MDSARGWRRDGAGRCCLAAGRRDGSSSRCRCPRSTEDPDGDGAGSAGPPARARLRHPPLPHHGPASPSRTSGDDLDGQPDGPPTDGTDRTPIPVVRGGPQSFAPEDPRDLAARAAAAPAGLGSRDPRQARGLHRTVRRTSGRSPRLAAGGVGGRVSRGHHRVASPSGPRLPDPRLSDRHLSGASAELPLSSVMLAVRARGGHPPRSTAGRLAGRTTAGPVSSVSSGRV